MANSNYQNLGYSLGQGPLTVIPSNPIQALRAPTTADKGYAIGQIWIFSDDYYALTSVADNLANWQLLNPTVAAGVQTLTGNTGGAISPVAGNINLLATQGFVFTGTAGTQTLSYTSVQLPATNSAITAGYLSIAGNFVLHTLSGMGGAANLWFGQSAPSMAAITSATQNISIGSGEFNSWTTASYNIAFGNTTPAQIGTRTAASLSTGEYNLIIGHGSGNTISTGSNNVIVGHNTAGIATLAGAASNNIYLGNSISPGVTENATTRIGVEGTQLRAFIGGIFGVTTDNNDAMTVLVDSAGQLGTTSSSARYKENIKDMGKESSAIFKLRPVTFEMKAHKEKVMCYGLIAEEVEKVMPRLVVKRDGQPESVKYQDLPALLLNELQKMRAELDELKKSVRK